MAVWKQSDYIYQEPESYLVKDRIGQFWDQRRLLPLWDGEEVEWEWKEMEEADVPGLNPGEEENRWDNLDRGGIWVPDMGTILWI